MILYRELLDTQSQKFIETQHRINSIEQEVLGLLPLEPPSEIIHAQKDHEGVAMAAQTLPHDAPVEFDTQDIIAKATITQEIPLYKPRESDEPSEKIPLATELADTEMLLEIPIEAENPMEPVSVITEPPLAPSPQGIKEEPVTELADIEKPLEILMQPESPIEPEPETTEPPLFPSPQEIKEDPKNPQGFELKAEATTHQSSNDKKIIEENIQFLHKVRQAHEQLLEDLNYSKIDSLQDDKMAFKLYLLEEIEKKILQSKIESTQEASQTLAISVYDEVMGFGPIEPLLRDPTITDIYINAPDCTYVERGGKIQKTLIQFLDHEHIFRLVQRVASKAGRHLDLSTPYFDAQLTDGSRIHAIIPPVAIDGIKVSLRKYQFQKFQIDRLVQGGSLTPTMARLLQIAVQARFNIAICGGTGSGKTTLLNSLLASIGKGERIITIEDTPELEPSHHHTVRLLTRAPNPEGKGAVTQADLMINALRMRPDRVILGELRGAEAFNLLHAMNTGQDGSMVTLHASGSEEVISRLLNMILMARYALSAESVSQQIGSALDLIVYVTRLVDGSRRVMTISQLCNDENGRVKIEDIFRYDIEKITTEELEGHFTQLNIPPTKRNLNKLIVAGVLKEYQALFDHFSKE